MRQTIIVLLLTTWVILIGAKQKEEIDFSDFELMNATAYCMGEVTANGSKVHEGGCACNPHLGEVAIVYTTNGTFLGYYECNDTGSTDGLNKGTVIDIYRKNYTRCEMFMKATGGKVYVKWIKGDG